MFPKNSKEMFTWIDKLLLRMNTPHCVQFTSPHQNLEFHTAQSSLTLGSVQAPVAKASEFSNELILAGKLQLKKLQKKKPEKNSGFDGA